jgi:hypothetical protein
MARPYIDGGIPQFDFGGHGPVIAVALFLPFIGGIALDVLLHTLPFFFAIGVITGILAALSVMYAYRNDIRTIYASNPLGRIDEEYEESVPRE